MAKCIICKKEFTPNRNAQQVTCLNPDCNRIRRYNVRLKREGRTSLRSTTRVCEICGISYTPRNKIQRTCSGPDCKLERKRRAAQKRWQKRTAICVVCNGKFRPRNARHQTCSVECRKTYERQRVTDSFVEGQCVICGRPYMRNPRTGGQTCSSECSGLLRVYRGRVSTPQPSPMDCPSAQMQTGIPDYPRFDCPEIDPLNAADWDLVTDVAPEYCAHRRAA